MNYRNVFLLYASKRIQNGKKVYYMSWSQEGSLYHQTNNHSLTFLTCPSSTCIISELCSSLRAFYESSRGIYFECSQRKEKKLKLWFLWDFYFSMTFWKIRYIFVSKECFMQRKRLWKLINVPQCILRCTGHTYLFYIYDVKCACQQQSIIDIVQKTFALYWGFSCTRKQHTLYISNKETLQKCFLCLLMKCIV